MNLVNTNGSFLPKDVKVNGASTFAQNRIEEKHKKEIETRFDNATKEYVLITRHQDATDSASRWLEAVGAYSGRLLRRGVFLD